ncbi:hypothetical protein CR513_60782, partial [Mucuna pruriens]
MASKIWPLQLLGLEATKNIMRDMSCLKENNKAYEGYLLETKHRLLFSINKALRAKNLLELIHIEIFVTIRSSLNNDYYILFIDKFSRMNRSTTSTSLTSFVRMKTFSDNLSSHILPNNMAKAVYTTIYILNRCPTIQLRQYKTRLPLKLGMDKSH